MSGEGWSAAGGILGSVLQFQGNRETNSANQTIAQDQNRWQAQQNSNAMQFSAGQTAQQQAFQERMSNTAYQRSMADMKAAGLNPILAYGQGGASSPGGSSASGVSSTGVTATMQNEMDGVLNSAISAAKSLEELELLKSQNQNVKADTGKKTEETKT